MDACADETAGVPSPREQQSFVRHELRAPLAVVYPVLAMLLDGSAGELSPRQREYLEIVDRNATRLEGMIASFADSGWLDCCAAAPHRTATALDEVVGDVLAARAGRWTDGPGITTNVVAGTPAALVDPEHARQILVNLLDNAVRFTAAEGSVTVTTSAGHAPGRVRLTVADTGVGIAAEEVGRVFEFGFRGAAAIDAGMPGLGIGLWVSRELAERNGGAISLASQPGVGTTAALELPAG